MKSKEKGTELTAIQTRGRRPPGVSHQPEHVELLDRRRAGRIKGAFRHLPDQPAPEGSVEEEIAALTTTSGIDRQIGIKPSSGDELADIAELPKAQRIMGALQHLEAMGPPQKRGSFKEKVEATDLAGKIDQQEEGTNNSASEDE